MTLRRALPWLLALAAAATCPAARAEPEPLSAEARARAERVFLLGRFEDLDAILGASNAPVDREPLDVLHAYWRAGERRPEPPEDASLSAQRIRRVLAERDRLATYPAPGPGGVDPYPVLSALVRDRIRRETQGVRGLPDGGPLAGVDDEGIRSYLPSLRVALGAVPWPADPEEATRAERMASLARRNGLLAAAAGTAFLVGALFLARRLGRAR
jgi:hypothetical protein